AVGEYVEPVQLQIVCQNLWDSLPPEITVITAGHLRSFGDVDEALKGFYENAVQKTISETDVKEEELRRWFAQELITPAGTRGTVYRGKDDTDGIPNAAVDILENEHILRGELRAGAHWYELTHDRLIEPIRNSNEIWLPDFEVEQARLRAREKLRRFRRVAVAVVLVLLSAAAIISFSMWQKAEQAREQEMKARVRVEKALFQMEQARKLEEAVRKDAEETAEKLRKEIAKAQPAISSSNCDHLNAEAKEKVVFDPKKQDLLIPNKPEFNPRNQITFEAWFNTDNLGTRQAIIYKPCRLGSGGEPYYQYNLELRQTGQLYFALAIDGIRRTIDGAFLVDTNKWYHVAATYDGKEMRLYLCGNKWEKTYPVEGTLSIYNTPLDIGVGRRGSGNPDRPFRGKLAEVRIWEVARSGDQIRAGMDKIISLSDKNGLVWSSTPNLNLTLQTLQDEGAKASQSTTWHEVGVAERAIDGDTDGNWGHGSVTHTKDEADSWWKVELPSPAMIEKIVIWNRSDCCGRRLSNFRVLVLLDESSAPVWSSKKFEGPVKQGGSQVFKVEPPVKGRFVKVQILGKNKEGNGHLSLAEVQVFGNFTE
ncbi:MAG: LamG-like jellyroll fold domain-containing protein, partial [Candidatus Hodarchaeota archaeon]